MPEWIKLDGAVNVRDVGGLSTVDGRVVRRGRLIRSDNLQDLTHRDLRLLIDELGVRAISDLRTGNEVQAEGPGPMTRAAGVEIQHNSLFVEAGINTDAAAAEDEIEEDASEAAEAVETADAPVPTDPVGTPDEAGVLDPPSARDSGWGREPVLLPWQLRDSEHDYANHGAVEVYWRYLQDRPDSIVGTLRLIARTDGAVIVHCAAGKDRTGVVVAIALAAVGVDPDQIIADFAQTAERIDLIFARLGSSPTYARDVADGQVDKHRPRPETMHALLGLVEERAGGIADWLGANGWTEADQTALERALLS